MGQLVSIPRQSLHLCGATMENSSKAGLAMGRQYRLRIGARDNYGNDPVQGTPQTSEGWSIIGAGWLT